MGENQIKIKKKSYAIGNVFTLAPPQKGTLLAPLSSTLS